MDPGANWPLSEDKQGETWLYQKKEKNQEEDVQKGLAEGEWAGDACLESRDRACLGGSPEHAQCHHNRRPPPFCPPSPNFF